MNGTLNCLQGTIGTMNKTLNGFQSVHPEGFFVLPVRVTPSRVMVNDIDRHVFPFVTIQIEMFCN
jgi:hypothetical protein